MGWIPSSKSNMTETVRWQPRKAKDQKDDIPKYLKRTVPHSHGQNSSISQMCELRNKWSQHRFLLQYQKKLSIILPWKAIKFISQCPLETATHFQYLGIWHDPKN